MPFLIPDDDLGPHQCCGLDEDGHICTKPAVVICHYFGDETNVISRIKPQWVAVALCEDCAGPSVLKEANGLFGN